MGAFHRALLVLGLASATEVAKVTKGNYDAFLQLAADEEQWVLLDFFAPWCGHCKRLNPVLDDFVADTPGVRVAKIDATAEKALAEAHDVDGYPTLRFRRAGSSDAFRDYKGARDAVGLAQLDARLRGPAVTTFAGALDDALTSVKFPPPVFVAAGRLPPDVEKAFAAVAASSYHMATFARLEAPDAALPADAVSAVEAGEWAHAWAPADDYERRGADVREAFVFGRLDGAKWDEYVATFGVSGADLPKILVIDLEGDKYYDDFAAAPPTRRAADARRRRRSSHSQRAMQ
ncbi:intramolecular oxidoreductase [Aureococcus anophagefferens]|nr:intramolecular oxidoreductase [Aureococcus anophagefferens]